MTDNATNEIKDSTRYYKTHPKEQTKQKIF
jgi:hypothetical protein